jgi:hypothetical protein
MTLIKLLLKKTKNQYPKMQNYTTQRTWENEYTATSSLQGQEQYNLQDILSLSLSLSLSLPPSFFPSPLPHILGGPLHKKEAVRVVSVVSHTVVVVGLMVL